MNVLNSDSRGRKPRFGGRVRGFRPRLLPEIIGNAYSVPMRIGLRYFPTFLIASLLLGATRASAAVTVDRKPAVIERKMFDPGHRPSDMPALTGHESAVTQSQFECSVTLSYQVLSHKEQGGGCKAFLKVQGISVALQLKIVIWLPEGATPKLSAHEEGHRQIAERVYERAEKAARLIAKTVDETTIGGQAVDCDGAEKQATQNASSRFCESYLDQTARPSARVSEIYDDLTAHGTREEPAEDEAIRRAFEMAEHESAAQGRASPQKE